MKKFKHIFLILLLVKSIYGFSQDYKNEIKNRFNDYGNSLSNKEYQKIIDEFWTEDYFKVFTKEETLSMFYEAYENPTFEINIKKFSLNEVSNLEVIAGKEYAFLTYLFECELIVKAKFELNEEIIHQIISGTNGIFGENSTTFLKKENKFFIKTNRKSLAIKDESEKKWKFFMAEKHFVPFFTTILPETILNQF